ncbi:MAG TPA: 4-alpha-glucanotransferase [Geobacteraceae bacterium]|nr:4-alpha-glucanotransferase [Geobacteraceae bacterium]
MISCRSSGILLHPTSLPGPGGIGSLGGEARRFIDFLAAAGQSLWQILPLGPPGCGNSPYSCFSAFAGNPLLIDLDDLAEQGDLLSEELDRTFPAGRVDFEAVTDYKLPLLHRAAERFFSAGESPRMHEFWRFCDNTFWLHDYALFMAAKAHFRGNPWNRWPEQLKRREPGACKEYGKVLGKEIGAQKYMQWQFSRQWHVVRSYANSRGVRIIGDAPIFVAQDSADVWCNQHLFRLDAAGNPTVVAGVPPDYFSKTGQRWGNPLYDWGRVAEEDYGWWVARVKNDLALYDIVRIDHFRGFEAYWEIPAHERTAVKGRWVKGPGHGLFHALRQQIGSLPIIAEDLGVITPDVEALRDDFGLPGMAILHFAFDGGPSNAYLPHCHRHNTVVYTGTHDNDTTKGWFDSLDRDKQEQVCAYLHCIPNEVVNVFIRTTLASVADYAIIPLQDLLHLDSSARMNIPGVAEGNWGWRVADGAITSTIAKELRRLTVMYNRLGQQ